MLRKFCDVRPVAPCLSAAILFVSAVTASAQAPLGPPNYSPVTRPTISPYLNLFNNTGGDGTLDYFNFVRPQQQIRNLAGQMTNEISDLDSGVQNLKQMQNTQPGQVRPFTTGRMAPTGHATSFANVQGRSGVSSGRR